MATDLTGTVRAPCPSCGAQLRFSAEKQLLACDHCGTTAPIAFSKANLRENPLAFRLDGAGELSQAPTEDKRVYACQGCGARTTINYDAPTLTCAFCGAKDVNPEAQKTRLIEPAGVLPFQLGRAKATEAYRQWIGSRWFAPNDLTRGAVLDNLHGLYVPFWTFDAQAHSEWSGEAGRRYKTGNQTRVDWTRRSGTRDHFYDDHLQMASRQLTRQQRDVGEVASYKLDETVDYDPRVLLGWEAEVYSIDLKECATAAEHELREREADACRRELGGDEQRNFRVDTTLNNQTFKHLLLPLWICAYVYNGQLYRVLINGQNGRIAGQHPLSWWKITLAVLAALLGFGIYLYLKDSTRHH